MKDFLNRNNVRYSMLSMKSVYSLSTSTLLMSFHFLNFVYIRAPYSLLGSIMFASECLDDDMSTVKPTVLTVWMDFIFLINTGLQVIFL